MGSIILELESSGSTAGYIPSSEIALDKTVLASKCANVVAGAGSVKSSAGTYIACELRKTRLTVFQIHVIKI